MPTLCRRCISAIQNRNEAIFIGEAIYDESASSCLWCEASDVELYKVKFAGEGR